jgi:hypothetical protein
MAGRGSSPGEEGKGRGSGAGGCALLAVEEEVEGDAMGGNLGLSACYSILCWLVLGVPMRKKEREGKRRKKRKGRNGRKDNCGKFSLRKIKHNLWDWSKNYFYKKKPNYN